jgi:hypothetical protein
MIDERTGLNSDLLLFDEGGGWCMYAWNPPLSVDLGDKSFLTHACAGREGMPEVFVFPDLVSGAVSCWRCRTAAPEGILGLWILHNEMI